jgi:DNA-binding PadR family transcriptional regulator
MMLLRLNIVASFRRDGVDRTRSIKGNHTPFPAAAILTAISTLDILVVDIVLVARVGGGMAKKRNVEDLIPLPSATLHILLALAAGPMHGYAIMRRVDDLSDGAVRMGPGTLYGSIKRMLADGLIEEIEPSPDDDERRRIYRMTGLGERASATEVQRLKRLLSDAAVRRWAARARPGLEG